MPALRRVETFVLRAPIEAPVRTSFGVMCDRPALIVRIEDAEGAPGWGEIWCNFPACGAEHRGLLVDTVFAPRLIGGRFTTPGDAAASLLRDTHILRLQTREAGPFDQVVAGIDIALWDLYARRRGQPLHRLLGADAGAAVPVYASGINPDGAAAAVARCRGEGHNAYKVKIGFRNEQDKRTLATLRDALSEGERLMVGTNQAWRLDEALAPVAYFEPNSLDWLEEPLPVDAPLAAWKRLAAASHVPLAGGENFASVDAFAEAIDHDVLGVLQPDLCKWGGISGVLPIAHRVLNAGRRYCPHYLGGGIGLIASAHCLAGAGGDGLLGGDANPNPLRSLLAQPFPRLTDGTLALPDGVGLGVEPDLEAVKQYLVLHRERT